MLNIKQTDWTIADLVDLEYFLAQDAQAEAMDLSRRDRELYKTKLAGLPQKRPVLLRGWLELRREKIRSEHAVSLPGEFAGLTLKLLTSVLFLFGGMAGISLAWGVLSYSGNQPINLIFAFLLLVAIPFVLTLVLSVLLPAWRLLGAGKPSVGNFGFWAISSLLVHLSRLAHRFLKKAGKSQSRLHMAQVWGNLRGRSSIYSDVMNWLAYRSLQFLGLGFSLGVLTTMLLRGWFTDLAFSWQTTIDISAEFVHTFVAAIAAPWSSLLPLSLSYPSLEQVAGSRVFLKEGLQHLANSDLQSWWYFLLFAIVTYTVLPRLVLLGVAFLGSIHARRKISFNDARCEALVRRMQRPHVRTERENKAVETDIAPTPAPQNNDPHESGLIRLVIPAELLRRPGAEHFDNEIENEFKTSLEAIDHVEMDETADGDFLESLAKDANHSNVLIILEGWQPCIKATLEYLKKIRQILGNERQLIVGLIGRENHQFWGTTTADQDFEIWRRRLAELGDPYLLVHNWGKDHE